MTGFDTKRILLSLEDAIAAERPCAPEPMLGDKWLLASAMQKGIRRGEITRATAAAVALLQQDSRKFWIRLHISALEDVSASPDVLVRTLTAVSSSTWRKHVGEERVAMFLTRMLCHAVKNRMADELYIQAQYGAEYAPLRERLGKADNELLAGYVADEENFLVQRSLALWLLFGTKKFPSEVLLERKGAPEAAVKVLRSLDAPVDLVESCIGVMNKTPWPLSIFQPLIWQTIQKQGGGVSVRNNTIPNSPDVEGIPLYTADMFTRVGQTCFRELKNAVPEFKQFTVKQIGLAVFYSEGYLLNKSLTSDFLEAFKQAGEIADVESVGLSIPDYMRLRDCLAQNMDMLTDIRQNQLQRYINAIHGKPTFTHSSIKRGE